MKWRDRAGGATLAIGLVLLLPTILSEQPSYWRVVFGALLVIAGAMICMEADDKRRSWVRIRGYYDGTQAWEDGMVAVKLIGVADTERVAADDMKIPLEARTEIEIRGLDL